MKLALRPIELDSVRTDGGTQVRERLDEAWVLELAALYEDGGHEIDPILLMEEGADLWLVDGFHRVEAMRRARMQGCSATVRVGTLDAAKMLAARMNKNGLPRNAGDKKRAILLALSTSEGKRMGVRELARHCGVSKSWAQEVLDGGGVSGTGHLDVVAVGGKPRQKSNEVLWARVDAALRADDRRPSVQIAAQVGCEVRVVRGRRKALGLPDFTKADAARVRPKPTVDAAEALLSKHPDWSNAKIAEESKANPETVSKLRARAGLPPRPRGPAPPRPVVVEVAATPRQARKQERAEAPDAHIGYDSTSERDAVKVALDIQRTLRDTMSDRCWKLLLSQWDEGARKRPVASGDETEARKSARGES